MRAIATEIKENAGERAAAAVVTEPVMKATTVPIADVIVSVQNIVTATEIAD